MGNIENDILALENRKPWFSLLSIILLAFGGLLVGQFVGMILVKLIYGIGLIEQTQGIADLDPTMKIPIYLIQGFTALFAFVLAPLLYLRIIERKPIKVLSPHRLTTWVPLVLTVFITLVFLPVNFKLMEWNTQLPLSDWMRSMEENLAELTQLLTGMNNLWEFLLAMLVIAILPAVGEELLFRGLLQNKLQLLTKNAHVAIWITAVLFSAIHVQFAGFIPRMMLGALFGYMYFWSGNLLIPILGHFVNNGIQIVMLYVYQNELTELNIDEVESVPWALFLSTTFITGLLLIYFKRHFSGDAKSGEWQKVYSTDQIHQAEIVKAVLSDNHLNPVVINKKDSAYDRFGDIEVHVISDQVMKALNIIDNEISFD